ncbi:hypothetical protein QVN76_07440 [Yersinia rochesterensis]|uniref:hypothetical protein n=1 Tax=Yersinia rochesterensis TaxID=1604335 RepID=UPI0025AA741C|nr:hypothetical protein [Yersinia rochesterensis]MDN0106724.1 hypothetical protein [Yersinia rochesterensis]
MELCDKRSIKITARTMEELNEALASMPGWKLSEGSTKDFPIALRRGEEFINFAVANNGHDVIATSVNIFPQDQSPAPDNLTEDVIFAVYEHIRKISDVLKVGISLSISEKDISKLKLAQR